MAMKIGYVIRNSGDHAIDAIKGLPQIAESLGYSTVWLTDHVIGLRHFQPVYEPEWAEIVTSMAYMAATTTSIRLGTGVLVIPYRDPVLTAKMIATIDRLSDGRVTLGIGAGWSKAEYGALGVMRHYPVRGAVTDESLDLMIRCWQGGEVDWKSASFELRAVNTDPVPVQRPHSPIWVGGQSPAALRRAARVGDAWHPTNIPAEEVATLASKLAALTDRPIPTTIRLNVKAEDLDRAAEILGAYAAIGCIEAAVQIVDSSYEVHTQRDLMGRLARRMSLT